MVDAMEKEADNIKAQCLKMAWYLRGGGTYQDVLNMSYKERTLVNELIKENMETTQKSKLPHF